MKRKCEKPQREAENPFAAPGAIDGLARALSIVLSEHYGENITVKFTPKKGSENNDTQTA